MKTTPLPRPPIVCRVVRGWNSISPGGGARHAESCAACRAVFATSAAFDAALRSEAGEWAQATPAPTVGFERRIVNAVGQAKAPPAAERSSAWRGAGAAATGLAVIAALAFFRPASGPTRDASQANAAMLVSAVESVSRGFVETVIPSAGALVGDNPMQREFDAIYADARSAVRFLAMNFLPESTI